MAAQQRAAFRSHARKANDALDTLKWAMKDIGNRLGDAEDAIIEIERHLYTIINN